jgi:hypothetical protein
MWAVPMKQIHEWFLQRGLPLVLTPRVRSRRLIERSAPMVSAVGALTALSMMASHLSDEPPDHGAALRMGIIAAVLVMAPFGLHGLRRSNVTIGRRTAALAVLAIFILVMPVAVSGWTARALAQAPVFVLITLLSIWLTYIGFGAIVSWAFRFAWVQLGAIGELLSRALPLMMLTVVVYFTGELWQLSARMGPQRLWQVIAFFAVVALLFVVATVRDEVRALREDRAGRDDAAGLLVGTPLQLPDGTPVSRTALSRAEKINVIAVMVVSQTIQIVLFTLGLFAFFLALGAIAIPDEVAVLWSGEQACAVGAPPCVGTWFDVPLPVPLTTVKMSLFVAVLSGLYFTVNTNIDPAYRQRFFEPLIADVAVSLAGRDAYLDLVAPRKPSG